MLNPPKTYRMLDTVSLAAEYVHFVSRMWYACKQQEVN